MDNKEISKTILGNKNFGGLVKTSCILVNLVANQRAEEIAYSLSSRDSPAIKQMVDDFRHELIIYSFPCFSNREAMKVARDIFNQLIEEGIMWKLP